MSKPPSPATMIRRLRAELVREQRACHAARTEALVYRQRATKAEQDAAEWKVRFDSLLHRTPYIPAVSEEAKP